MQIWVLQQERPQEWCRYYAIEDDAAAAMQAVVVGLRGEWVQRPAGTAVEWAFYELDERGELVQVTAWTLRQEELIFAEA